MVPRPIGEIFSTLTTSDEAEKYIVQNYVNTIEEIYSYPKGEISKLLVHIKDRNIFLIREELFYHFLDKISQEELTRNSIYIDQNNPTSNLRKRYKAHNCYEDMYTLAISILEETPHRDISKIITSSANPNIHQVSQISDADSAVIKELHKVNAALLEIR